MTQFRKLLVELREELSQIYSGNLRGIYLYGSYARKEQDHESDLDILIVLSELENYSDEVKRTSKAISQLSLKYGITVSRSFIQEKDWNSHDSPWLRNVREEGIAL